MKLVTPLLLIYGALTASAATINKRDAFHLYAYGTGIGGLPVYYSDGLAYVGNSVPNGSKVHTNITFTPATNNDWVITPTSSNVTISNSPVLYIEPSTFSLTNVGFTDIGKGETSGFLLFGNWAMWKGYDSKQLASNFYATPVEGCDGVFSLMWNEGQQDDGISISVAVRKLAPSTE
ncbi:hypothetical protein ACMFMG_001743 [Clarireedia jacksonii]